MKKTILLVTLLMWSFSASAFIGTVLRFIVGGALMTGAYFLAEETNEKYKEANKWNCIRCESLTIDDFSNLDDKSIRAKCTCYGKKYEKVIPRALLTVVLGGCGARVFLKGIIR